MMSDPRFGLSLVHLNKFWRDWWGSKVFTCIRGKELSPICCFACGCCFFINKENVPISKLEQTKKCMKWKIVLLLGLIPRLKLEVQSAAWCWSWNKQPYKEDLTARATNVVQIFILCTFPIGESLVLCEREIILFCYFRQITIYYAW